MAERTHRRRDFAVFCFSTTGRTSRPFYFVAAGEEGEMDNKKLTYVELFNTVDIGKVEHDVREDWEADQKRKRRLEQRFVAMIPTLLAVMFLVFYGLSAPHTASLIEMITPGWGWIAPVGLELGILIVAALMEVGWRNMLTFGILWMIVGMSIIINIAGGFVSVVSLSGNDISRATTSELLTQFSTLPATFQLVLLLVFPVGIIIPIMTKFTGEGIIKLALNKLELTTTDIEELWRAACSRVLYQGLYAAAVKKGAGSVMASKWAEVATAQWYKSISSTEIRPQLLDARGDKPLPAPSSVTPVRVEMGFAAMVESGGKSGGKLESDLPAEKTASIPVATPSKLELAKTWLKDNPSDKSLSGRELSAGRLPQGVQISHVTWNQAKADLAKLE